MSNPMTHPDAMTNLRSIDSLFDLLAADKNVKAEFREIFKPEKREKEREEAA